MGRYAGDPAGPAGGGLVLRTARLILVALARLHEAEHARASKTLLTHCVIPAPPRCSGESMASARGRSGTGWMTASSAAPSCALPVDGIEGIAPDEVEAGWWVTENRRNEGIATEAMEAAIDDLWGRTDVESITAYIEEGENEPSRRLAAKLGFIERGPGRGRSGEPMTVYELRRGDWQRR